MVLSAQEMRKVVEALERLNDYMVGHIKYEEEVTMPWLKQTGSGDELNHGGPNAIAV